MFGLLHTAALFSQIENFIALKSPRSAATSYSTLPLLICVVGIAAAACAIYLSPEDGRNVVQSVTILVTSGTAFATSLLFYLVLRRDRDAISRAIFFLSLGLSLWFLAEGIWSYYVHFLGVDVPFPSVADVFYLAAYLPIGYSFFKLSRKTSGLHEENKLVITTIAITLTAFITNVFILEIVNSAIGFSELSQEKVIILGVSIAYPLLDGFLFVPSIIILYSLRKSKAHIAWVLLAISTLVMAAADMGFGYTALVEVEALASETSWDILYNAAYSILATAMIYGIQASRTSVNTISAQEVNSSKFKDVPAT